MSCCRVAPSSNKAKFGTREPEFLESVWVKLSRDIPAGCCLGARCTNGSCSTKMASSRKRALVKRFELPQRACTRTVRTCRSGVFFSEFRFCANFACGISLYLNVFLVRPLAAVPAMSAHIAAVIPSSVRGGFASGQPALTMYMAVTSTAELPAPCVVANHVVFCSPLLLTSYSCKQLRVELLKPLVALARKERRRSSKPPFELKISERVVATGDGG